MILSHSAVYEIDLYENDVYQTNYYDNADHG